MESRDLGSLNESTDDWEARWEVEIPYIRPVVMR